MFSWIIRKRRGEIWNFSRSLEMWFIHMGKNFEGWSIYYEYSI